MKSALELLRELKNREAGARADETSCRVSECQDVPPIGSHNTQNSVAGPSLSEFPQSGRVVRWDSDVLGESVLVAGDAADVDLWLLEHPEARGAVVYRAREVPLLRGATPGGLRLLHQVKELFGGDVVAVEESA